MARRVPVTLVCSVCGSRNYRTTRLQEVGQKPLELKKHCSTCKAHTLHKESK
ncbi:MAG: 50S ribosomal protein L33 [Myxococcales bacterium]|nr:50S ribosomal protein L33 [Myxococcales bacterium]MBL8714533.1 50S ribosomal protein L33 [Myxococcales bacterium]